MKARGELLFGTITMFLILMSLFYQKVHYFPGAVVFEQELDSFCQDNNYSSVSTSGVDTITCYKNNELNGIVYETLYKEFTLLEFAKWRGIEKE